MCVICRKANGHSSSRDSSRSLIPDDPPQADPPADPRTDPPGDPQGDSLYDTLTDLPYDPDPCVVHHSDNPVNGRVSSPIFIDSPRVMSIV